jgi:hypothetical protein
MSECWINIIGGHGLNLVAHDKERGGFFNAVMNAVDSVKCRVFLTS